MHTTKKIIVAATILALGAGAASAAGLVVDPIATDTTSNWDGFYAGIFGGGAKGVLTTTDNFVKSPYTEDYAGFLLGLQAGYGFHLSDKVVGSFGVDAGYNAGATTDPSYTTRINWSAAATARLGLDLGVVTPYALAGIAAANATITDLGGPNITDSQNHFGYTIGAGLEVALMQNLSVNVEFRHTDYGTSIYTLTDTTTADLTDNSIRAGLSYHFN
jgi:opacity protein-like surface antigen